MYAQTARKREWAVLRDSTLRMAEMQGIRLVHLISVRKRNRQTALSEAGIQRGRLAGLLWRTSVEKRSADDKNNVDNFVRRRIAAAKPEQNTDPFTGAWKGCNNFKYPFMGNL